MTSHAANALTVRCVGQVTQGRNSHPRKGAPLYKETEVVIIGTGRAPDEDSTEGLYTED